MEAQPHTGCVRSRYVPLATRWRCWLILSKTRIAIFVASLAVSIAGQAHGKSYSWATMSGDWSLASNWGGTVPGSSDSAYIINGGTTSVTQSGAVCTTIYLGDPNSTNSGTIQMLGGSLTASSIESLGNKGTGTFIQSGGTNNVPNYFGGLYLGYATGASGVYNLTGSGVLSGDSEYLGYSGTGTFTQSGATNLCTMSPGGIYLGYNAGSNGTYNLNSGLLSNYSMWLGCSGTGTVNQFGGTNTANGSDALYLGYNTGSSGNYNLTGSGRLSDYNEYLGYSGLGTFSQSGAVNSVAGGPDQAQKQLYLGYNAGSTGNYILSGTGLLYSGSVECVGFSGMGTFAQSGGTNSSGFGPPGGGLYLGYNAGSSGTYTLSGSGLVLAQPEYVGYYGAGKFTQSGGTNNLSGELIIGYGASGAYNLTGSGLLSASEELVGYSGTGTFTQSGGTNSYGPFGLYLGYSASSSGTYNLSGSGRLLLSGSVEYVGYSGTATFNQSGGTNAVKGLLQLGESGTYNLTGGVLLVPGIGGNGSFNLGGGTLVAGTTFSISQPMVLNGRGGNGSINTGVNQVTLAGVLSGSGGLNKLGAGTLMLTASETYTGGTTISAGTLQVGNAATTGGLAGNIANKGTLLFDPAATIAIAGTIGGVGNLVKLGPGMLVLTASDTYAGGTTILAGTLQLGSGGTTGSLSGNIADSAALVFDRMNSTTFAGSISGGGSLIQAGGGELILGGSNSYTGGTIIDAGTLYVVSTESLPVGSSVTVGADATSIFAPATAGASIEAPPPTASVAVPEPGPWALLAASAAAAAVLSRLATYRRR